MTTYLLKTEPGDYSYDDLASDKGTVWDGVSNPAACIHIRAVKKGDEAFVYHTGNERAIVGLARITSAAYEDPNKPGLNGKGDIKSPVFDLKPLRKAESPVTLAAIKGDKRFAGFVMVREGRLSVLPVPAKLDKLLRTMAVL